MTDRAHSGHNPDGSDSHSPPVQSSRKPAHSSVGELLQKLLWSVPETAFMTGVSVRTVWRLMADPNSGFPKARRVRGRTLLVASEVIQFVTEGSVR